MKSLNLKFVLILTLSFSIFVFLNKQKLFQPFNPEVVNKYLRSQDILDTENKIKDRIFVSDEEIYIASGYLYVAGSEPRSYNFQHPPFIKYLFGFSAKYLNLPLLPNIIFGFLLLLEVYLLGQLVFKNQFIVLFAVLLLLIDPVFREVTIYSLLDLGQMVFILGFIITTLFKPKNFILSGVSLGLACASKFYSPVIIFLGIIYLYKLFAKQLNLKQEILVLFTAFIVFYLTYTVSLYSGNFNIFLHQAKIIKFMLDHNQAVEWGGVLKMFFGGYFLWPILFFVNLFVLFRSKFGSLQFIFTILPIAYGIVLVIQLPFTRYFILILPFLYLSFGNFILKTVRRDVHKT
jgi:predicted membrane-bound dolichyl-phosphate-mannose-protein mannosyltransferase